MKKIIVLALILLSLNAKSQKVDSLYLMQQDIAQIRISLDRVQKQFYLGSIITAAGATINMLQLITYLSDPTKPATSVIGNAFTYAGAGITFTSFIHLRKKETNRNYNEKYLFD